MVYVVSNWRSDSVMSVHKTRKGADNFKRHFIDNPTDFLHEDSDIFIDEFELKD